METLFNAVNDNRSSHKTVRENILILKTLELSERCVAQETDAHIRAEVCIAVFKFSDVLSSTVISFEEKVGKLFGIFLKD